MHWNAISRRFLSCVSLLLLPFFGAGCVTRTKAPPPPLILISMDGFRWDYLDLFPDQSANLRAMAREGVRAEGLIPVYPSNTFPSHYSIATGLYPSRSGIVNNRMFDAELGLFFQYNQRASVSDPRWWGGEPIWVTAAKAGRASACSFWIGSEAPVQGHRPTYWKPYDYSIPFEQRLEELIGWLRRPPAERPAVIAFYLEETNSIGHKFGPAAPEVAEAVRLLDGRLGALRARIAKEGFVCNYVVVSDHGMTACGPDRVVLLDDYIDLRTVQIDFDESAGGLRPNPGTAVEDVVSALRRMPHMSVYRSHELPAHFRIDPDSPRVPPIWIVPDEGWNIMTRARFEKAQPVFSKGQHGYDPALLTMHGILVAQGPDVRAGRTVPRVENIHVYNLLCALSGLKPARNDGDNRLVRAAVR